MKKSLRFYIAIIAAKVSIVGLKLLRRGATHIPGKIAVAICPKLIEMIDKPERVIAVTGTNGKTTVCNLIIDILKSNGIKPLDNRAGSNIQSGLATALIKGSSVFGKSRFRTAVFEVDERSAKLIFPYIKPEFLVCTNLFRDSLRRNAHAEYIFDIINQSLPESTKLILNADDSISSRLMPGNERAYYSIEPLSSDKTECINIINDMSICPKCHTLLKYEYLRYHHIGKVYCPVCGFKSPKSDYSAKVDLDNLETVITHDGEKDKYRLISNSIFNIYNEISAIALLYEFGLNFQQISNGVNGLKIVESRYSSETVDGIEIICHLTKGQNPVACSCVFEYIRDLPGSKEIILLLDDLFDRIDSSEIMTWIFDTDFEFLNSPDISHIIVSGVHGEDYRLRLQIAGIENNKISCVRSELDTPGLLNLQESEKIFILHDNYAVDTANKVKLGVIKEIENRKGNSL